VTSTARLRRRDHPAGICTGWSSPGLRAGGSAASGRGGLGRSPGAGGAVCSRSWPRTGPRCSRTRTMPTRSPRRGGPGIAGRRSGGRRSCRSRRSRHGLTASSVIGAASRWCPTTPARNAALSASSSSAPIMRCPGGSDGSRRNYRRPQRPVGRTYGPRSAQSRSHPVTIAGSPPQSRSARRRSVRRASPAAGPRSCRVRTHRSGASSGTRSPPAREDLHIQKRRLQIAFLVYPTRTASAVSGHPPDTPGLKERGMAIQPQ
jgi:hypothetical protein